MNEKERSQPALGKSLDRISRPWKTAYEAKEKEAFGDQHNTINNPTGGENTEDISNLSKWMRRRCIHAILSRSQSDQTPECWDYIMRHLALDPDFFTALARALRAEKKPLLFDDVENLLIWSWEEVEIGETVLPGLESWTLEALSELVRFVLKKDIESPGFDDLAIDKKRQRLNLRKKPLLIRSFRSFENRDGSHIVIGLENGKKHSFIASI